MQDVYALLQKLRHCVLGTTSETRPHCSLMAFLFNQETDEVYLLARTTSKKYQNIQQIPYVSLLFDTRELMECEDKGRVEAFTVEGESMPVYEEDIPRLKERILAADPRLEKLAQDPECAVLRIKVKKILHAKGVNFSRFIK